MLKTVGFPSSRTGDQTIVDGNLVFGTAGKGIDFSANPNPAGMTSELLNDYEEGTWTPANASMTVTDGTFAATGTYTKIGRLVYFNVRQTSGTVSANATVGLISGLPFTPSQQCVCSITNSAGSLSGNALVEVNGIVYGAVAFAAQTGLRISGFYQV